MHAKASFVFWLTLSLYLITLFTVSYVGVYLTYIAIPLLVISGLIMKFSTPKPEHKKVLEDSKSVVKEVGKATGEALEQANSFLDDLNTSLGNYNKVNELVRERAASYKKNIQKLKLEKALLEVKLNHADTTIEKQELREKIKEIDKGIEQHEKSIDQIRAACELEVKAP